MQQTSDYKIIKIIEQFKSNFKNKDNAFELLIKLKRSIEFNATVDFKEIYKELGQLFKDFRPYYSSGKFTPDPINPENMGENDIFCYGSNTEGKHGAGAAKDAVKYYGAIYGQAKGLQGNSYAIITKDLDKGEKSISLEEIEKQIDELINYAFNNTNKTFWLTKIACGLANYEVKDIAGLFRNKLIPENLILPKEFISNIYFSKFFYSDDEKRFYNVLADERVVIVDVEENSQGIFEKTGIHFSRLLPEDVVICEKDDYLLAAEEILKKLY